MDTRSATNGTVMIVIGVVTMLCAGAIVLLVDSTMSAALFIIGLAFVGAGAAERG